MKRLYPILLQFFLLPTLIGQGKATLVMNPSKVLLNVDESVTVTVKAIDPFGEEIGKGNFTFRDLRFEGAVPTSGIEVSNDGVVTGRDPGIYKILVRWFEPESNQFVAEFFEVEVRTGKAARIEIENLPAEIFTGSRISLQFRVFDDKDFEIKKANVEVSTSDSEIAEVDNLRNFYAKMPGQVDVVAAVDKLTLKLPIRVSETPVAKIILSTDQTTIKTGDVIQFSAIAFDSDGDQLKQVTFYYAVSGIESEAGSGASALIDQAGRFVAESPGIYTIMAKSGHQSSVTTVKVVPRAVAREVELIGHGLTPRGLTSDFYVWEGVDGKDYAVTGSNFGEGKAYFWNVTDPSNLKLIDSIQVDARNVNDVKVSEDGKICVISREGASNRKNGIVILDVTDPGNVGIITTYTKELTGGVHNVFIYKEHVYALSNGQRYDIINIEDPANPKKVGKFELDNPGRSIHDVWVMDGIAISSNWSDGVVLVDVGNGIVGGTPSHPVEIARSKVEGDANHAAFPYYNKQTGKFYVIAGDEIFPSAYFSDPNMYKKVFYPEGYLHFIDFTDPSHPKEVARYEVPEAGSHNFWVEDEVLYVGYYNGGLRIVDISGDLMGDLYKQGREIASFQAKDPKAFVPNHTMTWGAQPYKGHVFFSDRSSGLWVVKVNEIRN